MRHLIGFLLGSLLLTGCGDDDGGPPDAGNPADQCVSASDMGILAGYFLDGGMAPVDGGMAPVDGGAATDLDGLLRDCAQSSCSGVLLSGDVSGAEACMSACYATTPIAGLSQGCQNCFTHASICAGEHCAVPCLGLDRDLCAACVESECGAQRAYCTGL